MYCCEYRIALLPWPRDRQPRFASRAPLHTGHRLVDHLAALPDTRKHLTRGQTPPCVRDGSRSAHGMQPIGAVQSAEAADQGDTGDGCCIGYQKADLNIGGLFGTIRSEEAPKQLVLRQEVVAAPLEAVPAVSGAARFVLALRAAESLDSR
jgi:hypothetical protein